MSGAEAIQYAQALAIVIVSGGVVAAVLMGWRSYLSDTGSTRGRRG